MNHEIKRTRETNQKKQDETHEIPKMRHNRDRKPIDASQETRSACRREGISPERATIGEDDQKAKWGEMRKSARGFANWGRPVQKF